MDNELSYKSAIEEIESILEEVENGIEDIDILTKKVQKVSELLKFCKDKLRTTEEEVEKVLRTIET